MVRRISYGVFENNRIRAVPCGAMKPARYNGRNKADWPAYALLHLHNFARNALRASVIAADIGVCSLCTPWLLRPRPEAMRSGRQGGSF